MRWLVPIALVASVGCGATVAQSRAQGMHDVLNTVTEVVAPAYQAAVVVCDSAEGRVIDRVQSSYDQDVQDIDRIRERCDRVFRLFDRVRMLQSAARVAIDAAINRNDLIDEALDRVKAMHRAAQEARRVWSDVRALINGVANGQ